MDEISPEQSSVDEFAIIDKIYAVAVDPHLYEEFLDAWDLTLRGDTNALARRLDLLNSHASRAGELIDRLTSRESAESETLKALEAMQRPACICRRDGKILYANRRLATRCGTRAPMDIHDLGLDPGSRDLLADRLADFGKGEQHVLLKLNGEDRSSVSISLSEAGSSGDRSQVLLTLDDFAWNPLMEIVLKEGYDLTQSEISIVRSFMGGLSLQQIADQRDRSVETVRTQLKQIMGKTETRSQLELLRLLLSFNALTATNGEESANRAAVAHKVAALAPDRESGNLQGFRAPSGRRYDVHISGAPDGHVCLNLHSSMGFYLLPEETRHFAAGAGLSIWSVIRPGYGRSGPLPPKESYLAEFAADILGILDKQGVWTCSVVAEGVSFRMGVALANILGTRCRSLTVAAPTLWTTGANAGGHHQQWHRILFQTGSRSPALLPFVVKAGFAFARRVSAREYLQRVYRATPADMAAVNDPRFEGLAEAAHAVCIGSQSAAHKAYTDGLLLALEDWAEEFARVRCPVVVYFGDEDSSIQDGAADEWRRYNPNTTVISVPGAAHWVNFTESERIFRDLASRDLTVSSPSAAQDIGRIAL